MDSSGPDADRNMEAELLQINTSRRKPSMRPIEAKPSDVHAHGERTKSPETERPKATRHWPSHWPRMNFTEAPFAPPAAFQTPAMYGESIREDPAIIGYGRKGAKFGD